MYPGVDRCFGNCQKGAGGKYVTDHSQNKLKIRHDTPPLLGATLSYRGKHRVIVKGFLMYVSAMGCPFADNPE
jgi:hypothetical protein